MTEMKEYSYSSTQISIPNPLANEIIEWGEEKINDEDIFFNPDKPSIGREDHIHVTVLYGILDNKADEVKRIVSNYNKFNIHLGEISKFKTHEDFDVLKIDIKGKQLHELNKLLKENIDHTATFYSYKPHLTIAYVYKNKCENLIGHNKFGEISVPVTEITFSSKTGKSIKIKLKGA